jgi:cytochrome c5
MKPYFLIALVGIFLYSCANNLGKKSKSNSKVPAFDSTEIKAAIAAKAKQDSIDLAIAIEKEKALKLKLALDNGKEIYEVKCSRCHDFFEPNKYEAAKWVKIVEWMGPRAKIDTTEKEAILNYVTYFAKK